MLLSLVFEPEIAQRRDDLAFLTGRITGQEYRNRQIARGVGAGIGAVGAAAEAAGPVVGGWLNGLAASAYLWLASPSGQNTVGGMADFISPIGAPSVNVWNLSPLVRGAAIESNLARTEYKDWFHIGGTNNGKFDLIDFQKGDTVVSLKSLDTNIKSLGSQLGKLRAHIDELANAGITVGGEAAQVVLDLRVPKGGTSAASSLVGYNSAVTVVIKEVQ